ncbi:MAG: NAD(+)/NADH kinase [Planctomycetota bacterium]|nr:NAD(+)/NADH kinase [Planctomycetota bacterium]
MARDPRRVLIVGDRSRRGVAAGVAQHLPFLESSLTVVGVDLDGAIDLREVQADLVLVFGGDGSILRVAKRLGDRRVPVLGVNYGRFGFLADLAPADLEAGIRRWIAGDFAVAERARLRVRHLAEDGEVREWLALNDVVIGRQDIGRMVDIELDIDGRRALSCSGDGLILATATGSTAHALAAGGPLIDPTLAAVVIVPVAPHSLATRPIVLAGSHVIALTTRGSRAPGQFTVDGARPVALGEGDSLHVENADAPLCMVRLYGGPFFEALRTKLGWRGRPQYAEEGKDEGAQP